MDPPSTPPSDIARLAAYLRRNRSVSAVLGAGTELGLPGWYLGAGCIAQTVWNALAGFAPEAHIRDLDLVYFDPADLSAERESEHRLRLRKRFSDLPVKLDVKNQARVHLWYGQRFGRTIEPFHGAEEAIGTWPTTATCVGVRRESGQLTVCAPFGLDDLFAGIVRPNRALVSNAVYTEKARRWKTAWPLLRIEPW